MNQQRLGCSVAHITLKGLRCLQLTSINYVPSLATTSLCKITSVASKGERMKECQNEHKCINKKYQKVGVLLFVG